MATLSATDRIKKILADAQAEVEKLTADALTELKGKLKDAQAVVRGIEEEIAELTGTKPAKGKRGSAKVTGKTVTVKELESAIPAKGEEPARAIAKTLGTTSAEVLATAKSSPEKFKVVPNGPQPKIKRL